MTINAKIATYTMFFIIVLLFLGLGFNSVSKVNSAKLDPETLYISKLINTGNNILNLSDELYDLLERSSKINPESIITIEDDSGEMERISQRELAREKVEKIADKAYRQKTLIEKISTKESMQNYQEAIKSYTTASDLLVQASNEILYDFDNQDAETNLILRKDEICVLLGNNSFRIQYYLNKARKELHK
jgi:hypothetical protein